MTIKLFKQNPNHLVATYDVYLPSYAHATTAEIKKSLMTIIESAIDKDLREYNESKKEADTR